MPDDEIISEVRQLIEVLADAMDMDLPFELDPDPRQKARAKSARPIERRRKANLH